jgi:S-adenosylmethionine uptake transporter
MNGHSAMPYLVACLGVAAFSAMDGLMKGLSIGIGVYNALLWRMVAGTLLGGVVFLVMRSRWPARPALRLHVLRSATVAVMAASFFWGIVRVPLAEGIAITFVAPLIALYLARLLLGETIGPAAVLASLLGLAGVVTIAGGKLRLDHSADAVLGIGSLLFSSVLYAYNLILQRRQAQLAGPVEIAFFQNLFVLLMLAALAPFMAVVPSQAELPQILASAALALVALGLLSWAYARAEAQALVTVEYTAFIWAALLGWLMFDEKLTSATIAGTALIVAGCIIANYRGPARPEHVEAGVL